MKYMKIAAIPLIMAAYELPAQTLEQIGSNDRGIVEVITDRGQRQLLDLDDLASKIGGWIGTAADWVQDTYIEKLLEFRIDRTLDFIISDKDVREYLQKNYPGIKPDADVIAFSPKKDSAYVQVEYDIHFDDAKIIKQYLMSVDGRTPKDILGYGSEWAERYGSKITVPELFSVIKLAMAFDERWKEKKDKYDFENPGRVLEYEKSNEAFEILSDAIKGYNPSDDPLIIANDLTRAQIGIKSYAKDNYGNTDDLTSLDIEQYIKTADGWQFDEVIYASKWKEGILIGTEKNKFQNDGFWDRTKTKVKGWLDDAIDYLRE